MRLFCLLSAFVVSTCTFAFASFAQSDMRGAVEEQYIHVARISWLDSSCDRLSANGAALNREIAKLRRLVTAADMSDRELEALWDDIAFRRKFFRYFSQLGVPRHQDWGDDESTIFRVCVLVEREIKRGGEIGRLLQVSR